MGWIYGKNTQLTELDRQEDGALNRAGPHGIRLRRGPGRDRGDDKGRQGDGRSAHELDGRNEPFQQVGEAGGE
eukprot:10935837-Heterocapsa_arctica.AAC.1